MVWSVKETFNELLKLEECPRIEAKRSHEIGKSIMQTICAYSNEPGLGCVLNLRPNFHHYL